MLSENDTIDPAKITPRAAILPTLPSEQSQHIARLPGPDLHRQPAAGFEMSPGLACKQTVEIKPVRPAIECA